MFCGNCGNEINDPLAEFCTKCGARVSQKPTEGVEAAGTGPEPTMTPPPMTPPPPVGAEPPPAPQPPLPGAPPGLAATPPKSKMVAGLLGIFLGAFGIHRFYLGYTAIGIIQAVLGICGIFTCFITTAVSGIWGLIEGIMILTGSLATDAQGQPLVE